MVDSRSGPLWPYLFVVPIVLGVLFWLMASRRPDARVERNVAIVEYGLAVKGLSIAFLLFPIGISVVAILSPPKPEERWIPLQLTVGFLLLAIPFAAEVFRRKLRIEDDALVSVSPWTGVVRVPWADVTSVSYQQSMSWYVIESRGKRRVRVGSLMSGLGTLASTLGRRAARAPAIQAGIERMQTRREFG